MEFEILNRNDLKELTRADLQALAKNTDLMSMDLEGFAIQEDGQLVICDECGRFDYVPREGKYVIRYKNETGHIDCVY